MSVATALKHTSVAPHTDSNKMQTQTNVAASVANKMSPTKVRSVMYCSQKINGMPDG